MGLAVYAAHTQLPSTSCNSCAFSSHAVLEKRRAKPFFFCSRFPFFVRRHNIAHAGSRTPRAFSKLVCNHTTKTLRQPQREKKKGQCKGALHHLTEWTYRASPKSAGRKGRFTKTTGSREREAKRAVHTPRGQHKSHLSLSLRKKKKKLAASPRMRRKRKNTSGPDTTPSRVTTTTATGNEIRGHWKAWFWSLEAAGHYADR